MIISSLVGFTNRSYGPFFSTSSYFIFSMTFSITMALDSSFTILGSVFFFVGFFLIFGGNLGSVVNGISLSITNSSIMHISNGFFFFTFNGGKTAHLFGLHLGASHFGASGSGGGVSSLGF